MTVQATRPVVDAPQVVDSAVRSRSCSSWLPILVPTLAMLAMGLWGLDNTSMNGTEEDSYFAASLPWPAFLHLLSNVDAVHALYYMVIRAVFAPAGGSELLLRLPSVIGMTGAVALTAIVARRLSGSNRVALFSGLLMVAIPFVDTFAQAGRSYAIDTFGVIASSRALLWAIEGIADRRRRWVLYAALLTVTGWLHEMTLLVIAAHLCTLLFARARRTVLQRWMIATSVAVLLAFPVILMSYRQRGQLGWVRPPSVDSVRSLLRTMLGQSPVAATAMLALVLLGAFAGPLLSARRPTLQGFAVPLAVVPPVLLLGESFVAQPLFGGARYLLYCVPGIALLAGAGADHMVRSLAGWRRWLLGLVVVGLVATLQWPEQLIARTPQGRPQDMGAVARYLEAHKQPGDAVLYFGGGFRQAPLGYPADFAGIADIGATNTPEQNGHYFGARRPVPAVLRLMGRYDRIWVVGTDPPRPRGRVGAEARVLRHSFVQAAIARYHGVVVRLFVRRSPS